MDMNSVDSRIFIMRKNKNRGYQKLRSWNDAIEYYQQTFVSKRKQCRLWKQLIQYSSTPLLHYSSFLKGLFLSQSNMKYLRHLGLPNVKTP